MVGTVAPKWDKGLEGSARRIAASSDSFVHVLAGPGTGKTYALMRKVARLLEEGWNPAKILVVTFTRTAANDLRKQLEELGMPGVDIVEASTLHSLCFRLLQKQQVLEKTQRNPRTLYDFEIDTLLADLGDEFGGKRARKQRLEAYEAAWARFQTEEAGFARSDADRLFGDRLVEWLRFHDAMLVGELVPLTLNYLRENPDSRERTVYEHILVDEYQDLNRADQEVIEALAANATLTVVGDDNQSVYGFRYAHPEGILDFPDRHANTHKETLTECRRCPEHVIDLANALIDPRRRRPERVLRASSGNPPGEVLLLRWPNPESETIGIRRIIAALLRKRAPESPGDILVLVPRKQLGSWLRAELKQNFIPSETLFLDDVIASEEARERIALLQLLVDPADKAALRYWLGRKSSTGLAGGYARLRVECERTGEDVNTVLSDIADGKRRVPYTGELVKRYRELQGELERLRPLEGSRFVEAWVPAGIDELKPLRDNVLSLVDPESPRERLFQDIKTLITQPEVPTAAPYVRVMTFHKAKGLSSHTVVVMGLVEGLMPTIAGEGSPEEQDRGILEQRRLLYVAVTRAKSRLLLSTWGQARQDDAMHMGAANPMWAGRGVMRVHPSRFLTDLGSPPLVAVSGEELADKLDPKRTK